MTYESCRLTKRGQHTHLYESCRTLPPRNARGCSCQAVGGVRTLRRRVRRARRRAERLTNAHARESRPTHRHLTKQGSAHTHTDLTPAAGSAAPGRSGGGSHKGAPVRAYSGAWTRIVAARSRCWAWGLCTQARWGEGEHREAAQQLTTTLEEEGREFTGKQLPHFGGRGVTRTLFTK